MTTLQILGQILLNKGRMMEAHPSYPHTAQGEVMGFKKVQIHKEKVKAETNSHQTQALFISGCSSEKSPILLIY